MYEHPEILRSLVNERVDDRRRIAAARRAGRRPRPRRRGLRALLVLGGRS
jgi:hypothetical protein